MNYILSILIPTRNRLEYLEKCVPQCLGACSNHVQIIVHDNSDIEWGESEKYKREYTNFEYYHVTETLSFVDNFSKALEYAKGKFCCFIGDDDGVLPQIEEMANYMELHNIDAVSQNISATYFWPNKLNLVRNSEKGLLRIYYANNNVETKRTKKELKRLLMMGCQGYLERGLAKPYHGIVRTKLFQDLKKATGHFIEGLSPDIYASVSLSCLIDKVFVINYPITISGIGAKSGSAASATGAHTGKLSEAPHFKGHKNYKWDELVPQMYSVETIWADSALHAFRNFSDLDLKRLFGREYLLRKCEKKYPQFVDEYNEYKRAFEFSKVKLLKTLFCENFVSLFKRAVKKFFRRKNDYIQICDISDIFGAERVILEKLSKCSFNETLKKIR